jgi:hypothetical protein
MDWTNVPIIGWIVNEIAYYHAHKVWEACHAAGGLCWKEYEATWPPFDALSQSFFVTMGTFLGFIVVLKILSSISRNHQ